MPPFYRGCYIFIDHHSVQKLRRPHTKYVNRTHTAAFSPQNGKNALLILATYTKMCTFAQSIYFSYENKGSRPDP